MSGSRVSPILEILQTTTPVNIQAIRQVAATGLDNFKNDDRVYAWLAMMGLFPTSFQEWPARLQEMKQDYFNFVKFGGIENWESRVFPAHFPSGDFGLAKNSVMGIIHGDVVRTGRLLFFLPTRPIPDTTPAGEDDSLYFIQEHIRRIERILYIFSTLHVGIGYMQGFNELITPFYYVLIKSIDSIFGGDIDLCESVAFQMFQELIIKTKIHEFYTTSDKSSIILNRVKAFEDMLKRHLPRAADIITSLHIHPLFYSLRWFTLLFAQEHDLPSLLMIWDSLFSHFDRLMDYCFCIAVGHIYAVQDRMSKHDYAKTISALQDMQIVTEMKTVLVFSNKCWVEDNTPKKPISGMVTQFISDFFGF